MRLSCLSAHIKKLIDKKWTGFIGFNLHKGDVSKNSFAKINISEMWNYMLLEEEIICLVEHSEKIPIEEKVRLKDKFSYLFKDSHHLKKGEGE